MAKKKIELHPELVEDNRDRHGTWILDGGRLAIAYKWKCPFCFDRDVEPKPYCHNCGARLTREDDRHVKTVLDL